MLKLDNLHFGGPLGVTTPATLRSPTLYISYNAAIRLSTPYDHAVDVLVDIHRSFVDTYDCIGRCYLCKDSASLGVKSGRGPRIRI